MSQDKHVSVKELISNIASNSTQVTSNAKDEIKVAQAMLNDPTYVVDIYSKDGVCDHYSPYEDTREMISDILESTTKMSEEEAKEKSNNYKFDRSTASSMVNFSKEFVNTYLQTGRKLPLGAREKSNVALLRQIKEEKKSTFPTPTGIDAGGNRTYTISTSVTPEYETVKVYGKCPSYLKNKKDESNDK